MRQYYRKLIFMILISSAVLWAQDEVRMDLQVTLFMKLLKYDRNITQRGAGLWHHTSFQRTCVCGSHRR